MVYDILMYFKWEALRTLIAFNIHKLNKKTDRLNKFKNTEVLQLYVKFKNTIIYRRFCNTY